MEAITSELAKEAVQFYGQESQLDRVVEECSELIQAILHYRRNKITDIGCIHEIADVYITLESARHIFGPRKIEAAIVEKTAKFERQLRYDQVQEDKAWDSVFAKRPWKQNIKA